MRVVKKAGRTFARAAAALFLVTLATVAAAVAQAPATTGPGGFDVVGDPRPVTTAPVQVAPAPAEQPDATPPIESEPTAPNAAEPRTPEPDSPELQPPELRASEPQAPSAGPATAEEPVTAEPGPAEPAAEPSRASAPAEALSGDQAVETPAASRRRPRLVVSSWAGAYGAAQAEAVIAPIEGEMDIEIERRARGNEAQIGGADVVELGQEELIEACRAGRLVALSEWPKEEASGVGARAPGTVPSDFLVETAGGCGLPSFAWSSIVVANTDAMKKLAGRRYREPGSIGDLIDVRRYPGQRALIAEPRRLLEMMLLATGIERDRVYEVLATRQGEDQAFKALDALASSILWVTGPREAMAALDDGRATLAMVFSGRAFRRLVAGELKPIWDGHIIDYASWAVMRESEQPRLAAAFVHRALDAERLAEQARVWPYGPMRRSAVEAARRHRLLEAELDQFMPTSALRFKQGVVLDARFWAEHGERIATRFANWRAGVPLGIRVPPPRRAPPPPLPPPPRQAGFN